MPELNDLSEQDKDEWRFHNVLPQDEIANLPEGIAFSTDPRGAPQATKMLGEEVDKIVRENHINLPLRNPYRKDNYIGELAVALNKHDPNAISVVNLLLQRYPNLSWLRGGSFVGKNGIVTMGAEATVNGHLGSTNALEHAYKDYFGTSRVNPTLYIVRLSDLLEGLDLQAITLGTEHIYDVTLRINDLPQYLEWSKAVKAFRLGLTPDEQKDATHLLKYKAINKY